MAMERVKEITVTQEHLDLLQHMYVGWQRCEFGAPEIDPKRPYGNSDVISDIGEILGIPHDDEDTWGDSCYGDEKVDYFTRLHKETQTVLQILLQHLTISPGAYYNDSTYGNNWKRVDDGATD